MIKVVAKTPSKNQTGTTAAGSITITEGTTGTTAKYQVANGTAASKGSGATFTLAALNVALRANIVGIVITSIQVAVVAFIAFNDAIMKVVNTIKDHFIQKMKEAQLAVLNFVSKLKIFPKTSKEAEEAAKKLREELKTVLDEMTYHKIAEQDAAMVKSVNETFQTIPNFVFMG